MNAIKYNELNQFFSTIGKSLNSADIDKQYIWMGLYVCDYMASIQKTSKENLLLDEQFFINALHVDNLTQLVNASKAPSMVRQYAGLLKSKMLTNNIIGSLLFVIQNELKKDKAKELRIENMNKFNKGHMIKSMKLAISGGLLAAAYYATGSIWVTSGVGIGLIVANIIAKRASLAIKRKKEEVENQKDIENGTWTKNHGYQNIEKLNNLANWGDVSFLSQDVNTLLEETKKYLITFSSFYPQKKRIDNVYMENDIVRINDIDVPKLLNGIKDNVYDLNTVKEVLVKMNQKLKDHIDVLTEESERELIVTKKYWETKVGENSSIENLKKVIENEKEQSA